MNKLQAGHARNARQNVNAQARPAAVAGPEAVKGKLLGGQGHNRIALDPLPFGGQQIDALLRNAAFQPAGPARKHHARCTLIEAFQCAIDQ